MHVIAIMVTITVKLKRWSDLNANYVPNTVVTGCRVSHISGAQREVYMLSLPHFSISDPSDAEQFEFNKTRQCQSAKSVSTITGLLSYMNTHLVTLFSLKYKYYIQHQNFRNEQRVQLNDMLFQLLAEIIMKSFTRAAHSITDNDPFRKAEMAKKLTCLCEEILLRKSY